MSSACLHDESADLAVCAAISDDDEWWRSADPTEGRYGVTPVIVTSLSPGPTVLLPLLLREP